MASTPNVIFDIDATSSIVNNVTVTLAGVASPHPCYLSATCSKSAFFSVSSISYIMDMTASNVITNIRASARDNIALGTLNSSIGGNTVSWSGTGAFPLSFQCNGRNITMNSNVTRANTVLGTPTNICRHILYLAGSALQMCSVSSLETFVRPTYVATLSGVLNESIAQQVKSNLISASGQTMLLNAILDTNGPILSIAPTGILALPPGIIPDMDIYVMCQKIRLGMSLYGANNYMDVLNLPLCIRVR